MNISNILSTTYLFNTNPGPFLPIAFKIVILFFGGLVILGFLSKKMEKQNSFPPVKKFFYKLNRFFSVMGISGLAYVFMREQGVYLLSTPILLLVWAAVSVVWAGSILKYYFTDKPKREEELKQEADKKKFLPR